MDALLISFCVNKNVRIVFPKSRLHQSALIYKGIRIQGWAIFINIHAYYELLPHFLSTVAAKVCIRGCNTYAHVAVYWRLCVVFAQKPF